MFALARGTHVTMEKQLKNGASWKNSLAEGFLVFMEFMYVLIRIHAVFIAKIVKFLTPAKEKNLGGQIALVTGTGHGIGRELVLRLAAEGCTIVGWDINEEGNAQTNKLLKEKGFGNKAHFYVCDITKREDVLATAQRVQKEVGDVTLLINNAGVMICKPLTTQSQRNIETVVNVNLMAHFWTLEAFLPKMKETNMGHIVAMCSACSIMGLPNAVPYCASKFGVKGLMEALSEEARVSNPNSEIKFTTINPITVDTGLCKHPKHRFPSAIKILTPEYVAECTVKAIKREMRELSIPASLSPLDRIMRLFPMEVYHLLRDFLGVTVDPEQ